MFRVTCGLCGLSATHIRSGPRGVTSFDADECAVRCQKGRDAAGAGEPAVASVAGCEHLIEALNTQAVGGVSVKP